MITIRRSAERGSSRFDWLDSRHTFSFGHYHDPAHMGFGDLLVINEDRVRGGAGFPTHGHRDMEILSVVLEGALEHADTLGNRSVIRPGEVQRMSAGTGIRHSEYNHAADTPVHFLQIWIAPNRIGLPPGYEQRAFADSERSGRLRLVAAPDGRDGAVTVHQDARMYSTVLEPAGTVMHRLADGRRAWVQIAFGRVRVNGIDMEAGDGAGITGETTVRIEADAHSDLLLFDLR